MEIERVKDYRALGPGDTEKVEAATKLSPLCNNPGEEFAQMTQAEWDKKHKDYKTTRVVDATATHARHRVRHAMTTGFKYGHIFITDAKRFDPPAAPLTPARPEVFAREKDSRQDTDVSPALEMSRAIHAAIPKDDRIPSYEQLHEMGKAAAAGVRVVIAPQLFPTPPRVGGPYGRACGYSPRAECVLHYFVVLAGAQQHADRRVLMRFAHIPVQRF